METSNGANRSNEFDDGNDDDDDEKVARKASKDLACRLRGNAEGRCVIRTDLPF